jgi:hypothetical protein
MISQRFNPEKYFAPIPFEDRICLRALEMKKNGLAWRPHVGCFVWDPDLTIKPDSPFPGRIYFILSLKRFIEIFETVDRIAEKLVWLPTWHQAQLVYSQLAGTGAASDIKRSNGHTFSTVAEFLHIYGLIIDALEEKNHQMPSRK